VSHKDDKNMLTPPKVTRDPPPCYGPPFHSGKKEEDTRLLARLSDSSVLKV